MNRPTLDSSRIEELRKLQALIDLASRLNQSSGIVKNIQRLEELANELKGTDYENPRKNLTAWLTEVAEFLQREAR
jgi:hypothetical protein